MFHSVLPSPFSTGIFRRTLFLDSLSKTSQQPMQQHKKHITRRLIEIHKQRQQHDNQQQFTKREYTLHPLTSPQVMRQRERRKNRESKSDGSNNALSRVRSFGRRVRQSREREIARRSKQAREDGERQQKRSGAREREDNASGSERARAATIPYHHGAILQKKERDANSCIRGRFLDKLVNV